MSQEQTAQERIAQIRESFNRLKATCGLQAINRQTIQQYAEEIRRLQAQIN